MPSRPSGRNRAANSRRRRVSKHGERDEQVDRAEVLRRQAEATRARNVGGNESRREYRPEDNRREWGSDQARRLRIDEQRRQAQTYSRYVDSRQAEIRRESLALQNQRRNSQYRYQQDYWNRLRMQRQSYNWQTYDYYNDPYFRTAPSYRYYRSGNYYTINRYAADILQQAVNYGYAEGMRAGGADRYDGWRYSYREAYPYRDATFGYRGMYVAQNEYRHYFREGFQRGYEDGYYGRRRYGRSYNGSDMLLGNVLSLILNLQPYRF